MASKRKLIIDAAITALEAIKKSSGYNTDIQSVFRGLKYLEDVSKDKMPCVCFAGLKETRKNINKPQFQAAITVTLVGYVSVEDGTDSLQTTLDDFIEDVTKALETDRTFNFLTLWNEIQTIETDRGDIENTGAFAMTVVFHYASAGVTP